jgi:hypothetical protein
MLVYAPLVSIIITNELLGDVSVSHSLVSQDKILPVGIVVTVTKNEETAVRLFIITVLSHSDAAAALHSVLLINRATPVIPVGLRDLVWVPQCRSIYISRLRIWRRGIPRRGLLCSWSGLLWELSI